MGLHSDNGNSRTDVDDNGNSRTDLEPRSDRAFHPYRPLDDSITSSLNRLHNNNNNKTDIHFIEKPVCVLKDNNNRDSYNISQMVLSEKSKLLESFHFIQRADSGDKDIRVAVSAESKHQPHVTSKKQDSSDSQQQISSQNNGQSQVSHGHQSLTRPLASFTSVRSRQESPVSDHSVSDHTMSSKSDSKSSTAVTVVQDKDSVNCDSKPRQTIRVKSEFTNLRTGIFINKESLSPEDMPSSGLTLYHKTMNLSPHLANHQTHIASIGDSRGMMPRPRLATARSYGHSAVSPKAKSPGVRDSGSPDNFHTTVSRGNTGERRDVKPPATLDRPDTKCPPFERIDSKCSPYDRVESKCSPYTPPSSPPRLNSEQPHPRLSPPPQKSPEDTVGSVQNFCKRKFCKDSEDDLPVKMHHPSEELDLKTETSLDNKPRPLMASSSMTSSMTSSSLSPSSVSSNSSTPKTPVKHTAFSVADILDPQKFTGGSKPHVWSPWQGGHSPGHLSHTPRTEGVAVDARLGMYTYC